MRKLTQKLLYSFWPTEIEVIAIRFQRLLLSMAVAEKYVIIACLVSRLWIEHKIESASVYNRIGFNIKSDIIFDPTTRNRASKLWFFRIFIHILINQIRFDINQLLVLLTRVSVSNTASDRLAAQLPAYQKPCWKMAVHWERFFYRD